MAIIKRNNVRKFGSGSPDLVTAADGFIVGGAIMAPHGSNRVKSTVLLM